MKKGAKQKGSAKPVAQKQKWIDQNKEDEINSHFAMPVKCKSKYSDSPIQFQSAAQNYPKMNPQTHQPKYSMNTLGGSSLKEIGYWLISPFRSNPDTSINVYTTTRHDKSVYDDENPITDVILPGQVDNLPVRSQPIIHRPMFQDNSTYIKDDIFKKFDATLLTSPSKYHTLSLDGNARALNILPGASFIAYCSNCNVHDSITPVIINKGFYPDSNGLFTLNEEVSELECGLCKQIISDHNSFGIGFTDCKVVIKYRDTRQVSDTFSLKADWDVFKFAKFSLNGDTKFYFVKFNIVSLI